MAHSEAKPKTQKFDFNEFKSTESQTQIILHQIRIAKNDVVS